MDIITPHISCVVLASELQDAIAQGFSEIFVMTSQGIIKHHKLRGQNRFIRLKVDKLPVNYKETQVPQEISFLPAGKIPVQLFDQVVQFFKQVMDVKKSELEAMIWICWDAENGYHLIVPDQRVSKASASYDWASLPPGKTIVCDIHSHNTMGAFFSGTDNRDDQGNIGFSGVVGHLKNEDPQTVWRFNYKDKKLECDFDDIFTVPKREVNPVPENWIEKIQTPTYAPGMYQGGNSQKGKADHLKAWQFKKGGGASADGNRAGPHLQDQRRLLPDGPDNYGLEGDNFDWASWVYKPEYPLDRDLLGGHADIRGDSAERALASLNEDPSYDRSHLGVEVGLAAYDPRFDPDIDQATGEIVRPGEDAYGYEGDDRFEEISVEHGKNAAEVFCFIDDTMSALENKDDLLENLMSDMIHMCSDDQAKEKLFRRLFEELPDVAQERIQMNGIC